MRAASLILASALLLALYVPFAGNGFLYDDYAVVLEPAPLQGPGDLGGLLLRPFYPGLTYYRPLSLASYQVQRAVVGERPWPFHATNALLAVAVFLLAHALLRLPRLRIEPVPAVLAAALFVAHPVASSCVLPIAGRDTLLASICVLGSVYAFCRSGWRWSVLGLATFALALLSKEMAVVVPGLVLLADVCGVSEKPPGRDVGAWVQRYLLLAAVLAAYLLVRQAMFSGVDYPPGSVGAFALSYLYALQTVVVPFADLIYEPPVTAWLSWWRAGPAIAVAGGLGFALWRRPALRRAGTFWAGWFFVALLPTANLVGQETRFAERYVFLALLAVPAVAATLASASWERAGTRRATLATGVVLLLGAAAIVLFRGPSWEEEAFYRAWIRHDPERVTAHYNFGTVLEQRGKGGEAFEEYRIALELEPDHDGANNNLGRLLVVRGDVDGAYERFVRAVERNPANHQAHNNLGSALALRGDLDGAMEHFRRSVELAPRYKNARANLGHALVRRGEPGAAIEQLEVALRIDPDYADARFGLASAYLAQGRTDDARAELEEALRLNPGLAPARQLLERIDAGPAQ